MVFKSTYAPSPMESMKRKMKTNVEMSDEDS